MSRNISNIRAFHSDIKKVDRTLGRISLKIAIQNLNASNQLYQDGYYPEAIFFLQQAMEKGCKSFGFFFGIIDKNEAWRKKDVGHVGTKVYDYTMEDFGKILEYSINGTNILQTLAGKYDIIEHESDIDELRELAAVSNQVHDKLTKLSSNTIRFNNASFRRLNIELSNTQRFSSLLKKWDSSFRELTDTTTVQLTKNAFEEYLGPTQRRLAVLKRTDIYHEAMKLDWKIKRISEGFNDPNKSQIIGRYLIKEIMAIDPLLQIAYITQPHESSTRYYFNSKSPAQRYNKEHTLVRLYPDMYAIGKVGLDNLHELFYDYRRFSYVIRWLDTILKLEVV